MPKNHSVRIIGGTYKRSKLDILDIEGLRPTPDRLRETLFNWLGNLTEYTCLDIFAGSGVLGFECLSRGATKVVMLEKNKVVYQQLQKSKQKLKINDELEIIHTDSLIFIQSLIETQQKFDLIFIDPPYASNLINLTLPNINNLIYPHSLIYLEYNQDIKQIIIENKFLIHKSSKIGQIFAYLIYVGK